MFQTRKKIKLLKSKEFLEKKNKEGFKKLAGALFSFVAHFHTIYSKTACKLLLGIMFVVIFLDIS